MIVDNLLVNIFQESAIRRSPLLSVDPSATRKAILLHDGREYALIAYGDAPGLSLDTTRPTAQKSKPSHYNSHVQLSQ